MNAQFIDSIRYYGSGMKMKKEPRAGIPARGFALHWPSARGYGFAAAARVASAASMRSSRA
jgi:hypothetical protein